MSTVAECRTVLTNYTTINLSVFGPDFVSLLRVKTVAGSVSYRSAEMAYMCVSRLSALALLLLSACCWAQSEVESQ